ncbi:phosphate ABC transporter substrate-binding/OmpA family protein [Acanthopleuribacter pedis]|uniref:OmpA family protein n=1 Tax=Acanthopleuribacter pedis TaxID=442870 RepID=A0A8J7QH76_9BACT|nr:phosphate ABC transporter substrate-binding/OmpA family protein [Acanthopleuribacter pedis]MBO1317258.1 OmpA family protein [Acanthopleuribacter pedis]MBO1318565.1 OmpA family protein [Acanthopleuribacter pedis]
MKKSTVGFIIILVLGALGIFGWKAIDTMLTEQTSTKVSRSLKIGGDNYLGYWFINAPEMRKQAVQKDFSVEFSDDGGAYAERLKKFAAGEYDCIVLPINTYLEQGKNHDYPGVIVAAVSESKGADGMVVRTDRFQGNRVNDLNDPKLSIVYTPDSPSSFLLDLTIADFDLDRLAASDGWRAEADGSSAVLERVRKGEGDVFVMWEPDLSKALALDNVSYLWGSDKFSGYIIDVFVFHRDLLKRDRALVEDFLGVYFNVLDHYAEDKTTMVTEMARATGLKKNQVEGLLKKVDWFDLEQNCTSQFGIALKPGAAVEEGVINSIIAATDVLKRNKRLESDPLEGNPYQITNRALLESLARQAGDHGGMEQRAATKRNFEKLSSADWRDLREVGTFRLEPITFQTWNNLLTNEGKARVDRIATTLTNNYQAYRIIIRGHTGPGGDEKENTKLSRQRAEVVKQYLIAVHGINANRLQADGVGSSQPLPRKQGESQRAYGYRLPRVEFVAVEGNQL